MATRRPKVPKATPAPQQPTKSPESGEVIAADFGGRKKATASPRTSGAAPAKAAPAKSAHAKTAPAKTSPAKVAPAKTGLADGKELGPVPAKAFSGRMLALAVVMIAITILLAPTVKIFIDKRAEISALQADIAARQAQQDGLNEQISRWQDPHYVKQQARDRINMVMPGETGYWVFGSDLPAGKASSQTGQTATQDPAKLPWVDSLWESVRRSATD